VTVSWPLMSTPLPDVSPNAARRPARATSRGSANFASLRRRLIEASCVSLALGAWSVVLKRRTDHSLHANGAQAIVLRSQTRKAAQVEYERAAKFMASIGVWCPAPDELQFGGVIGSVLVVDVVERRRSRWFHGPAGLLLEDARPVPFMPVRGQVGLFRVQSPAQRDGDRRRAYPEHCCSG
jgi:hypothetical protein